MPDNTKQCLIDLTTALSDECWSRLHKIGISNEVFNEDAERNTFKSSLDYYHLKCWIAAICPCEGYKSSFERETFAI